MNDWVQREVPTFAVVGRVNMGKSAVIATLLEIDDNELIRISPTPGETTRCQLHRVVFSDRECLRFIDTPGFSRPVEAMRAIQQIHGAGTPGLEALKKFVAEAGEDFGDEKRLLEPLIQGAGVLYVVDPGKPLRDDFLAEMEILRWTGSPRLALLNRRDKAPGPDEEAWKTRLSGAFNLVRTFDAHHARYEERLRLLKALLEIEETHREQLEETIHLVENEWQRRREEAVEAMISFLEDALCLRVSATLEERDLRMPTRRGKKTEELSKRYFLKLADAERGCFGQLLKIYRHHLLRADSKPEAFQGIDLESKETWSKFGLSRTQLVAVSAALGASAGMAVDIGTVFFSHGAGTAIGALLGGGAAWFKGGSLPDLRISLTGGVKLGTGEGKSLTMGPPKNPNFPWILLDGVITRYQKMLARAHGRRDEEILEGGETGFTRSFPAERRALLGKWFSSCLKGTPNRALEPEVFEALLATLEEVEDQKEK
jgi:GTPase Era involved in 16S rRNA processing